MVTLASLDVQVGDEIPSLIKRPTTRQLVQWAGATGIFAEIHFDKDFAVAAGLPGVNVPGPLIGSFLAQMVTSWVGDAGTLRRITVSHRGMCFPGQDITCRGSVTKRQFKDGLIEVELKVWAQNNKAEITSSGTANVMLHKS